MFSGEPKNHDAIISANLANVTMQLWHHHLPGDDTLEFDAVDLMPVVNIIRTVPDGHRMLQTLKPAATWEQTQDDWNDDTDEAFLRIQAEA